MLDRAGLAREAAAFDGRYDVILARAIGNAERLVDDKAQRRTSEIDFLLAAVDDDLARAWLQPDARDGVLAAAGRISAAMLVELLLTQRRGVLSRRRSSRSFAARSFRSSARPEPGSRRAGRRDRNSRVSDIMRPPCSCGSSTRRRAA